MASKVYLLVRRDLTPDQRLVQACHALVELVHEFTDYDRSGYDPNYQAMHDWVKEDKTLVVLGVKDQKELELWEERLTFGKFLYKTFTESHFGTKTAMAIHPHLPEGFFMRSGLTLL